MVQRIVSCLRSTKEAKEMAVLIPHPSKGPAPQIMESDYSSFSAPSVSTTANSEGCCTNLFPDQKQKKLNLRLLNALESGNIFDIRNAIDDGAHIPEVKEKDYANLIAAAMKLYIA